MIQRYSRPDFAALWSDAARFALWLEVELAACEAMERDGRVPAGTADQVAAAARGKLDPSRIAAIEATTRHDVIAFLTHVEELAGEPARWLHLGMTSSDVLDTVAGAADRPGARGHRARPGRAPGPRGRARSPAQGRAVHRPVPRHPRRADHRRPGVRALPRRARPGGRAARAAPARPSRSARSPARSAPTPTSTPAIEAEALGELGLCARDRGHARSSRATATPRSWARWPCSAAAIEQIALDRAPLAAHRGGRGRGGLQPGQKGSSAMPHKKNPILSENLCGLARLVRGYAGAALEDVALWHERDISHSSVERVILPDATILADFMLARAAAADAQPGRFTKTAWSRTSNASGGLIFSRGGLLALVKTGLPRQRAYEMVQRNALRALREGGDFRALLGADPEVGGRLSRRRPRRRLRPRPPPPPHRRDLPARLADEDPLMSTDDLRRHPPGPARSHPRPDRLCRRWARRYEGKVRDNYITGDGRRIIVVSDRLSAFDRVLSTIPFKGQVLNQLAQYWFEETAAHRAQPRARGARPQRHDRAASACRSRPSWSCAPTSPA